MISSMTGYGTSSVKRDDTSVTVEIRSVNHRFLDVHVRMPREYLSLESDVHQAVKGAFRRGRIDVSVAIQCGSPAAFEVSMNSARGYLEAASRLRDEFRLDTAMDAKTLLSLPGVVQSRDNDLLDSSTANSSVRELLEQGLREGLESVVRMREQEGGALQAEMKAYLDGIAEKSGFIQKLAPTVAVEYRKKLEDRLAQLLPQNAVDPQRLAQEVAMIADKADISEEMTRLESHVRQYADLMESGKDVGKKLDFLLQEMQREVNTVLSKSANLEITRHGIAIKADIEKLREQAQNVE